MTIPPLSRTTSGELPGFGHQPRLICKASGAMKRRTNSSSGAMYNNRWWADSIGFCAYMINFNLRTQFAVLASADRLSAADIDGHASPRSRRLTAGRRDGGAAALLGYLLQCASEHEAGKDGAGRQAGSFTGFSHRPNALQYSGWHVAYMPCMP